MTYRPRVWYKCPKCHTLRESDLAEELCHHPHEAAHYIMHRANVVITTVIPASVTADSSGAKR